MKAEATPRPWLEVGDNDDGTYHVIDELGGILVERQNKETCEAVARAVNAHDALVGAVAALLNDYRTEGCPDPACGICSRSRAALALAKAALAAARKDSG
jgi:hypothetical protein